MIVTVSIDFELKDKKTTRDLLDELIKLKLKSATVNTSSITGSHLDVVGITGGKASVETK